jgi:glucose-6-phosphate 1-dehydrogenase
VETYVAVRLAAETWRWAGVPILIRANMHAGHRHRGQQPGSDIRAYDRLIGATLDGDRRLFARQDTVEAAWKVVNPG